MSVGIGTVPSPCALTTGSPATLERWRALQVDRRWERMVTQKLEEAHWRHKSLVTPADHGLFLSCAWLGLAWWQWPCLAGGWLGLALAGWGGP